MDKLYLEELIAEGLTQKQIAARSGRNRSTVKRWLKRYGLKTQNPAKPEYAPLTRPFLEEMMAEGLSVRTMVERCGDGRTSGSVKYWLEKYDIKFKSLPRKCVYCEEDDPNKFIRRDKQQCKTCKHYHAALRIRKYKEEAVAKYGGKCVRCGYNKCAAGLEFHHPDPTKKDPKFKRMRGLAYCKNEAEFDKCKLLCSNCHREEHYNSFQPPSNYKPL